MKGGKIIIFTQKFDLDADAIILRLREMGQLPARVNFDDATSDSLFSLQLGTNGYTGRLRTRNRQIELNDIRSAYWRAPSSWNFRCGTSSTFQSLIRDEVVQGWREFWAIQECYWMNAPEQVTKSEMRLSQLKRATAFGFEVPRTLVTSRKEEALAFGKELGGRLVLRDVCDLHRFDSVGAESSSRALYSRSASIVSADNIKMNWEGLADKPYFFQEVIEKALELRVTLVGDEAFVVEIDSKDSLRSSLDWLHDNSALKLRKGAMPNDIEGRCFLLMRDLGLNYCVIDLILTPDGKYVFLEINPNGKILPIDRQLPDLNLVNAVAACLLRGSNGI